MNLSRVFISLALGAFLALPTLSALDPVPAGTHVVLHIPALARFQLETFVKNAPQLPAKPEAMLKLLEEKLGFNPFKDILSATLFVKQGETRRDDEPCALIRGNFDTAKLEAWIAEAKPAYLKEEKLGEMKSWTVGDKISFCFPEPGLLLLGKPNRVIAFLEGRKSPSDFEKKPGVAEALKEFKDEALVQFIVHNPEKMAADMKKKAEKGMDKPGKKLVHDFLVKDIAPHTLTLQVFDGHALGVFYYNRGEKAETVRATVEFSDPEVRISKILALLAEHLPELQKQKSEKDSAID